MRNIDFRFAVSEKISIFASDKYHKYTFKLKRIMETTKKKRTREEVRAAVRETIRRKKEWIEESNAFLERIYQQRLAEQSWLPF